MISLIVIELGVAATGRPVTSGTRTLFNEGEIKNLKKNKPIRNKEAALFFSVRGRYESDSHFLHLFCAVLGCWSFSGLLSPSLSCFFS